MATDLGTGDVELPWVDIAPADSDTSASLTVYPPTGSSYLVTASGGQLEAISGSDDLQQRWTADTPVTYDQASRWVLRWTVTGTGEGSEDYEVYVVASPVAGGPSWTPGRSRVANYVPHRTLVRSPISVTGGQDQHAWTFDSTTTPPGISVDRLIADGVAWVTSRVHPLNSRVEQAAAVVTALYAAAAVERSAPQDDQSLQRANDLEKRLDLLMTDLIAANSDANDQDLGEGDYAVDIAPAWAFPAADLRWDYSGYW